MAGKTEYKNNWQKENVDRVNLTMPKGRKETIKAHAEAHGQSVNSFINRAIAETIERDNGTAPSEANELKIIMAPKKKESICGYAEDHGESVDNFVLRAIIETMTRDIEAMDAKISRTDPGENDSAAE